MTDEMKLKHYSVPSSTQGHESSRMGDENILNYLTSASPSRDFDLALAPCQGTKNETLLRIVRVIGEKWMLSILLNLQTGNFRFSELERNLGISSSMLHSRLKELLDFQVIESSKQGASGKAQFYRLTPKGTELLQTLRPLDEWCRRHDYSEEVAATNCIKNIDSYLTGPMNGEISSISTSKKLR